MKNSMFRNEHGRSFLNDAIRGGRETQVLKNLRTNIIAIYNTVIAL